jgi:hypothetical protein
MVIAEQITMSKTFCRSRLAIAAKLRQTTTHRTQMQPKINFIERGRLFRRELKRRGVRFLPMQVLRRVFEEAGV